MLQHFAVHKGETNYKSTPAVRAVPSDCPLTIVLHIPLQLSINHTKPQACLIIYVCMHFIYSGKWFVSALTHRWTYQVQHGVHCLAQGHFTYQVTDAYDAWIT